MPITYYRHDDASAPTMTGEVSSLINLLDKCLVTGYGSKSPAGWTKPFTGTNKAVFRMATGTGKNGHYLRVLDDGTASDGGARCASLLGFTAMTTVDAGTGQFPNPAQILAGNAGFMHVKSNTADATARPWILVADDTGFWIHVWHSNTTSQMAYNSSPINRISDTSFAQVTPLESGAQGPTLLNAKNNSTYADTNLYTTGARQQPFNTWTANSRLALSRDYINYRTAAQASMQNSGFSSISSTVPDGFVSFPNSITGDVDFSPVIVTERDFFQSPAGYPIQTGYVPFLYGFNAGMPDPISQGTPLRMFDVFNGTGADTGRSFMVIPQLSSSTHYPVLLQISGNRL